MPHSLTSHLQSAPPKDKTLSFPFCRKNESHFHQQQSPTENTGRGDKIGFLCGAKFYFLLFSEYRVGTMCFGTTWGAEWHCWKHQLTKVTCRDCVRLLRCFCLFWHDECLMLSEIMKCVVVRCRVCQLQQGFSTFSLHCRPLTTLLWTLRLNHGQNKRFEWLKHFDILQYLPYLHQRTSHVLLNSKKTMVLF